jgi:hypothetical protein
MLDLLKIVEPFQDFFQLVKEKGTKMESYTHTPSNDRSLRSAHSAAALSGPISHFLMTL